MKRFTLLATCVLTCSLLGIPARADEPPKKLTKEERKELEAKWKTWGEGGTKAYQAGKIDEAAKAFAEALKIARRLYPNDAFPNGATSLATSLNNLAAMYKAQAKLTEAEPLFRDAIHIYRRLFKGDHAATAASMNNLAELYRDQAKLEEAEPLYRDALAMRKRLFKGDHPDVADSLNNLAVLYYSRGKFADAEPLFRDALAMKMRLFKGDHPDVADSLNNLAFLLKEQGKYTDAEPLYHDALAMRKRLFKGDHPNVAQSLNNLAELYQSVGRYPDAEPLYREALDMYKRVFKRDDPDLATSLNNLASVYQDQGRYSAAKPLYLEALEMKKRLYKSDHPDLALSMNNLAALLKDQADYEAAEPLFRDALAMTRRLFKGDHPAVATELNGLAGVFEARGKYADAEPLYRDALAMNKRLFKGDHPDLVLSLHNLAYLYYSEGKYAEAERLFLDSHAMRKRLFPGDQLGLAQSLDSLAALYDSQGKHADAEPLSRDAFAVTRRLITSYAGQKSEGEALTLIGSLPLIRDTFVSNAIEAKSDARTVYAEMWTSKGLVARAYEQRQLAARVAVNDLRATKSLADLASSRRRRAELILAPIVEDPATRTKRATDLKELEQTITKLDTAVRLLLPTIARMEQLANAKLVDLQTAIPIDAAVVDFHRFTFFEQDVDKPGMAGEHRTKRYLAFVVTKEKIAVLDLDTAEKIETAVATWREHITGGKELPATIPAKVRELVWDKVRKELPANIKTVYISPGWALCCVPWGALPGDKPGTILLEDYAVATIPHATFLLDKLWPQEPLKNPPTGALVVGGVKYDAEAPVPLGSRDLLSRGDPLVKPGEKPGWSFLPGTVAEATGVSGTAAAKKLTVTAITGDKATTPAILAALPKAKYAHFATHGFFADPSFRSVFQLDEKDYEKSRRGERIGRAMNSPMVMTGLVLAGANNPKTPGRGIITGEALIDLDLSGLELAVLSACETGLGDVAGGEGTFGPALSTWFMPCVGRAVSLLTHGLCAVRAGVCVWVSSVRDWSWCSSPC